MSILIYCHTRTTFVVNKRIYYLVVSRGKSTAAVCCCVRGRHTTVTAATAAAACTEQTVTYIVEHDRDKVLSANSLRSAIVFVTVGECWHSECSSWTFLTKDNSFSRAKYRGALPLFDKKLTVFNIFDDGRSVRNMSTNVCAEFRCAPPRIKKALWIFRELITATRTTRVAFWDPPGTRLSSPKNTLTFVPKLHNKYLCRPVP